jgi:hypothetical protein
MVASAIATVIDDGAAGLADPDPRRRTPAFTGRPAGSGSSPRARLVVLEGGRSRAGLVPSSCRPVRLPAAPSSHRRPAAIAAAAALTLVFLVAGWLDDRSSVPTAAPAGPAVPTVDGPGPGPLPVYVVQPGDTLWSIARRLDPAGDVRATVDRLVERHGSAIVDVGDRIPLDGLAAPP